MTNYLIRTIEHNGQPFTDVTKIRDNETYQVVEAESKEEAEKMAMGEVILRPVITKNYQPPEFDDKEQGISPSVKAEKIQRLIDQVERKDSE